MACPLPAAGCERLMCSNGASTPAVLGALACAVGFLAGLSLLFTDPYKNFLLCLQTEMVKAILLMAAGRHHALMSVAHVPPQLLKRLGRCCESQVDFGSVS